MYLQVIERNELNKNKFLSFPRKLLPINIKEPNAFLSFARM